MRQFILLSTILLILCSCSRYNSLKNASSTDLAQENIAEMKLDIDINNDFRRKFGDLELIRSEVYDYYRLENGLEIACKDNKTVRIIIHSDLRHEAYRTTKGITIGSTISEVKAAYGKNFYIRIEQGAKIIGYHDKINKSTIEFWTVETLNKVTEIRFDKDFVE